MKPLSLIVLVILFPLVAHTQGPEAFPLLQPESIYSPISELSSYEVKKLNLEFPSQTAPLPETNNFLQKNSNIPLNRADENPLFSKFKLKHSSSEKFFPHLGSSYHIKSSLKFTPHPRFRFSAGAGLIRMHTALSPNAVMKYSQNSEVQYSFSQGFKLRLYYQSVQNIRKKPPHPLIYMNPLFPQSEYGAEISAKINNWQLEFGPRSIINTGPNSLQNLNMINSSISVGF